MDSNSVTVIITCYNRKAATLSCLASLEDPALDLRYIITDDASTDGSAEAVRKFASGHHRSLTLIEGSGSLFWAGGMRTAMDKYLTGTGDTDYVALVNDDVVFDPGILRYMIGYSLAHDGCVAVGATRDSSGGRSYGGSVLQKGSVKFSPVSLEQASSTPCDVFNCNCTLFPNGVFRKLGSFDPHYTHSMADYDYAFSLKRLGIPAFQTDRAVGMCNDNPTEGSWRDPSLPRKKRLSLKESPKGLPRKEYFYFLKKNFGPAKALWHSLTPYLKILLKC